MIQIFLRKTLHAATGPMLLDVHCDVLTGEFLAITGASGSGKTTLLRLLAGLATPEEGRIEVNGRVWLDHARRIHLPIQQREVGLVFQDYALFPNMTVRQNLEYGLRKGQSKTIIDELIAITELDQLLDRYPVRLRADSNSGLPLPGHWCASPNYSYWTSRCLHSTPACACACKTTFSKCIRHLG